MIKRYRLKSCMTTALQRTFDALCDVISDGLSEEGVAYAGGVRGQHRQITTADWLDAGT